MINQNNIILKYLLMTLLTMMTSMYFIETKLPMYDVIILGLTVSIIYVLDEYYHQLILIIKIKYLNNY